MRCDEFEQRLNELLDRRIAPDDDAVLYGHARRCPPCADRMAAHLVLSVAVRQMPRLAARNDFPFRVMHQVEVQRRSRGWRRRWSLIALTTATAFLLSVTIWRWSDDEVQPSGPSQHAAALAGLPPGYELFARETEQLANIITARQWELMGDLAEGMKPVASSFGAAFSALRRTLPFGETPPNAASG